MTPDPYLLVAFVVLVVPGALIALLLALFLLYCWGIQFYRGGALWKAMCLPALAVAFVFDVVLNYTVLALLTWDFPQDGEYTFSVRLKRLRELPGWRGVAAHDVIDILNEIDPTHAHIV